jgi:hypothetical protein
LASLTTLLYAPTAKAARSPMTVMATINSTMVKPLSLGDVAC